MEQPQQDTYNPWSVVNLVFHHLAEQGLHPVLGSAGDPAPAAAQLLQALGIRPLAEASEHQARQLRQELDDIRAAFFDDE
ncbi:MAG TPA: hypothetical protein VGI64_14390 [Streptosporangiaceae bacterium]|jgi:hypothetical protein